MLVSPLVALAVVGFVLLVFLRTRRRSGRQPARRRGPGAGAAGAVYELLNEDRRRALEIIVEERAEATDPEHKEGNLPDLEGPRPPGDDSTQNLTRVSGSR